MVGSYGSGATITRMMEVHLWGAITDKGSPVRMSSTPCIPFSANSIRGDTYVVASIEKIGTVAPYAVVGMSERSRGWSPTPRRPPHDPAAAPGEVDVIQA